MILFGNDVLQAEKHEEIAYAIEELHMGTFEDGDTLYDSSPHQLFLYQDKSSYKFEPNINAVLFTIGKSKEDKILQFWSFEIETCIYYEYFERKLRLIRWEDDAKKTVTLVFSKMEDAREFFRATRITSDRAHAVSNW